MFKVVPYGLLSTIFVTLLFYLIIECWIRQGIQKAHFVQVLACSHGDGLILSGSGSSSEIYKEESYDWLFKGMMVNLMGIGSICSVDLVEWSGQERHIKILLLERNLNKHDWLYWADVDSIHADLSFLTDFNSCFTASPEDSDIVDPHYEYELPKLMSGNLIVMNKEICRVLLRSWIDLTMATGGVVDDQWAFESLRATHPEHFEARAFMSYKPGKSVLHIVGPNKLSKLKTLVPTKKTTLIRDHIRSMLVKLDSQSCFDSIPSGKVFLISKSIVEGPWTPYDAVTITDDRLSNISLSCLGHDLVPRIINKVDLLRYVAVYSHGGWYVDADTTPLSMDELIWSQEQVVSIEENYNLKVIQVICQWAFRFSRGSIILRDLIQDIMTDLLFYNKVLLPTSWFTGPIRFSRHLLTNAYGVRFLDAGSFTDVNIKHQFEASWTAHESWDEISL